ncbi:MAG TPA: DUF5666 domain-containing protein [Anaerolineaceae bacterium]|nr:DUF5666 domain-containing protein [Anaerolineaceae bacterium]
MEKAHLALVPSELPLTTPEETVVTGKVESISDTSWVVAGKTIIIDATTEIIGTIEVGSTVTVKGTLDSTTGIITAATIELSTTVDNGQMDQKDDGQMNNGDNGAGQPAIP